MANDGSRPASGDLFTSLAIRIKLIGRLMLDRRVSFYLKLIPVLAVGYLFIPEEFFGPVDDLTVLVIGMVLFVEMCPPKVVAEHMKQLKNQDVSGRAPLRRIDENVIDGEFYEVSPEKDGARADREN